MKLYKFFGVALAALALTACSNDDNDITWNTAEGVTVQLDKPTVTFKEGKGLVNVPLTLNGDANGAVAVTVACTEYGEFPAEADTHYVLTSNTIVITNDEPTGVLEFNILDSDKDINPNRQFQITIVSVEHGAIDEANSTTIVDIKDNDSDFYDMLAGSYRATIYNYNTGAESQVDVQLIAFDEDEEGYNQYYILEGLQSYTEIEVDYVYDLVNKEGHLEIPYGQYTCTVNFTGLGACDVYLGGFDAEGYLDFDSAPVGYWNEDLTKITFPDEPLMMFLPYSGGWYIWNRFYLGSFER